MPHFLSILIPQTGMLYYCEHSCIIPNFTKYNLIDIRYLQMTTMPIMTRKKLSTFFERIDKDSMVAFKSAMFIGLLFTAN